MGFPMIPNLHGGMSKSPCLYDIIFIFERLSSWPKDTDRQGAQCGANLLVLELRPAVISLSPAWLVGCSFSARVGFQRHSQVPEVQEHSYSLLCNLSHGDFF